MKKRAIAVFVLSLSLVMGSMFSRNSVAATTDSKATKSDSGKSTTTTAAPSNKEISDAKSKGMVWVNTSTGVYHKEGKYYGKTKRGKFMSEDDATKAGYREAKTEASSKSDSKASTKKP